MQRFGLVLTFIMVSNILIALNPSKEYEITPDDYGMNYKEVRIPTEDQFITLNAWFFPSSNKAGKKMIIMSDDGNGNMADNLEIASNFLSLGYNVVMYDYRGYGKSDAFEVKTKFYIYSQFQKDLDHVIKWGKKYHAKLTMVDLYGIGIGAGLSICAAVNNLHIRRAIADAPYTSFEEMKKRYKSVKGETLLMPLGYNKVEMEPKFALAEKGMHIYGILVIVAENDPLISFEDLKTTFKGTKVKKYGWYIRKGADNNEENFSSATDEYFSRIKAFLEKH